MARDWLKEAQMEAEELKKIRHQIHSWPELGNREFQTSAFICQKLEAWGIQRMPSEGTAVCAVLRAESEKGKAGKASAAERVAAFRADMDALPLIEKTAVEWASRRPGIMHGCGHDFHTAALLGAAFLLSKYREELKGTIKFFFQPDEEGEGGAARMIEAGALENPRVEAVFGAHVDPALPAGWIGFRAGAFYAASDMFTVRVEGRSAHGAQPEKGIDALRAAAAMILKLDGLTSRGGEGAPWGRAVVTVGKMAGGSAQNVLADQAEFSGIIRSFGRDNRRRIREAFYQQIHEVKEESGCLAEVLFQESYPGVVNHQQETEFVREAAADFLGRQRTVFIAEPLMTTEDFGYFLQERGGCFFHFGVGGDYPLHHPSFCPADDLLPVLTGFYCKLAEDFFNKKRAET